MHALSQNFKTHLPSFLGCFRSTSSLRCEMNKQTHLKSPARAPAAPGSVSRGKGWCCLYKAMKMQAEKAAAPRSSLHPQHPGGQPGGSLGKPRSPATVRLSGGKPIPAGTHRRGCSAAGCREHRLKSNKADSSTNPRPKDPSPSVQYLGLEQNKEICLTPRLNLFLLCPPPGAKCVAELRCYWSSTGGTG